MVIMVVVDIDYDDERGRGHLVVCAARWLP